MQAALEEISEMAAEVSKQFKTKRPIQHKVVMGQSFSDLLIQFAKKSKTDIIVMGTRGASGLKKYVVGSNTTSVIEKSKVPVLVVPEGADFKSLKNLVLATDLKSFEEEVKKMMPFLKAFEPTLHVLHITPNDKEAAALGKMVKETLKKYDYRRSTVTIHVGKNVPLAIESFVGDTEHDVLSMFTHDYSMFDQVFNRSITKKMAFQSSVPLLAFKK